MLSGTTVADHFHVTAPLSCGGMGQTWLAEDDRTAEPVVVKTVRPDLIGDDDVELSFKREIMLTARFTHAHVVRHLAHGCTSNGLDFLALAHINGVSLADLLFARPSLPIGPAVRIARDVAEALAYIHDDGVVHADVSPQNILIDRNGNATLIDFGAAVTRETAGEAVVVGKPSYLSPEQSRGGAVDGRSDQYSLGVVLWESIAGRSLFEGNAARRGREIPPLGSFAPLPFMLDAVVMRMLAFDAGSRFGDCDDACTALGATVAGADDTAHRMWLAERVRRVRPRFHSWKDGATRKSSTHDLHASTRSVTVVAAPFAAGG